MNEYLTKATPIALSGAAIAGGLQLTEQNVWAGVTLVIVGLALPYLREYLKTLTREKK